MDKVSYINTALKPVEPLQDLLEIQLEMLETINRVEAYSQNRGLLGGLDWGMESLNKAFEGLNPGLILVAGQANVGKSAFCMQVGWQIALANRQKTETNPHRAYVLYFSLDDNATELLPRIISIDQRIPINVVKAPKKYKDKRPDLIARRNIGVNKLKDSLDCFKIIDSTAGTSLEFIEAEVKRHSVSLQMRDESYKLVVIVDNFHDVTVDSINFRDNGNAKFDYIAGELSRLCTQYDIPIICTAELRKLNGNRRPVMDDVRESVKIAYEAKAILLCYNEVGLRGESASVYFNRATEPDFAQYKQPVLEVKVGKNKYTSFKGRMFYEFYPECSYLREVLNDNSAQKYNQMILT